MDITGSTTARTKPRRPNEADWTWLRPVIEQEYKKEGKTRQQVCASLLALYGIEITENVFKRRVSRWNLDKKRKREEMLFAVKVIRNSNVAGKATTITIRGEQVTEEDVQQYFKRRPLTSIEQHRPLEDMPTPIGMILNTAGSQYSTPDTAEPTMIPCYPDEALQIRTTDGLYESLNEQALTFQSANAQSLDAFLEHETQPTLQPLDYQPQPVEDFLRRLYHYAEITAPCESQVSWNIDNCEKALLLRSGLEHSLGVKKCEAHDLVLRCCARIGKRYKKRMRFSIPLNFGWIFLAVGIACAIDAANVSTERDYMLSLLYYVVSDQLGPCNPAIYLISSAACTDRNVSLREVIGSTLLGYLKAHERSGVDHRGHRVVSLRTWVFLLLYANQAFGASSFEA